MLAVTIKNAAVPSFCVAQTSVGFPVGASATLGVETLHKDTYRGNLGDLISRLHGKYFSDEQPPFSGMPSTVIHQTQEQKQSMQVERLLEIQSQICEKLPLFEQGTPQRKFLDKVKDSLRTVKSASGLITLILQTAKDCGVPLDELASIFS